MPNRRLKLEEAKRLAALWDGQREDYEEQRLLELLPAGFEH